MLHSKRKKPQWRGRRGTSVIKSNPIHALWVTHKLENNYIAEVLPQEWKFWVPHQAPQPEGLQMGGGAPRESSFEGQKDLIPGIPQTEGTRNCTLRGHTQGLVCTRTQGKKQWPHKGLGQTYLLVLEGLSGRRGVVVAHYRDNTHIVGVPEGEERERRYLRKYLKR